MCRSLPGGKAGRAFQGVGKVYTKARGGKLQASMENSSRRVTLREVNRALNAACRS